jgi:hypothetical protein
MCTVLLPTGVNPIAVNKYIDIDMNYKGEVIPAQTMKAYGGADLLFHSFLCSAKEMGE